MALHTQAVIYMHFSCDELLQWLHINTLHSHKTLKRGHFSSCLSSPAVLLLLEACFLLFLLISNSLTTLAAKQGHRSRGGWGSQSLPTFCSWLTLTLTYWHVLASYQTYPTEQHMQPSSSVTAILWVGQISN